MNSEHDYMIFFMSIHIKISLLVTTKASVYIFRDFIFRLVYYDTNERVVTKAVNMVWYTLANRHVVTEWYVHPVYLQGLEFRVTYGTETLRVNNA
jgi:hypothetical protein